MISRRMGRVTPHTLLVRLLASCVSRFSLAEVAMYCTSVRRYVSVLYCHLRYGEMIVDLNILPVRLDAIHRTGTRHHSSSSRSTRCHPGSHARWNGLNIHRLELLHLARMCSWGIQVRCLAVVGFGSHAQVMSSLTRIGLADRVGGCVLVHRGGLGKHDSGAATCRPHRPAVPHGKAPSHRGGNARTTHPSPPMAVVRPVFERRACGANLRFRRTAPRTSIRPGRPFRGMRRRLQSFVAVFDPARSLT
jgi:hypothetical protein